MLDEKIKITNLKKQLYVIIFLNLLLSNFIFKSNFIILILLVINIISTIQFVILFQNNNLIFKKVFKCYFEISYILISIIYIFYSIFILKRNLILFIPLILILAELPITRLFEINYKLDNTRSNFFSAVNSIKNINEDITIWWKLKLYFNPKFDSKNFRKDKKKESLDLTSGIIICVPLSMLLAKTIGINLYSLILLVIISLQSFIKYLLDISFKFYVQTEGICIEENKTGGGKSKVQYIYRIVDFNNKREINIISDSPYSGLYQFGDKVTVIHGAISKVVFDHYLS